MGLRSKHKESYVDTKGDVYTLETTVYDAGAPGETEELVRYLKNDRERGRTLYRRDKDGINKEPPTSSGTTQFPKDIRPL